MTSHETALEAASLAVCAYLDLDPNGASAKFAVHYLERFADIPDNWTNQTLVLPQVRAAISAYLSTLSPEVSGLVERLLHRISLWQIIEDGDAGNEPMGSMLRSLTEAADALASLSLQLAAVEGESVAPVPSTHLLVTAVMVEAAKSAYWHEVHNGGGYSDKCYEAALRAALASEVNAK